MSVPLKPFSWKRMIEAVEAVRERMLRAAKALREANIPYAVAGGNAVAAWIARVELAAVRNTQNVEILIRRADFDRVKIALEAVGFQHHELMGVDCFIDGPDGSPRDAVHILYANEKVRPEYIEPTADVDEVESAEEYDIVPLSSLVRMKLNSFRDKDRMHLRDMLELGIIDGRWPTGLAPLHAERLQRMIDDPDG